MKIVSELLGHAKVSTTYDIYLDVIPSMHTDAINVLDKWHKECECGNSAEELKFKHGNPKEIKQNNVLYVNF